MKKNDLINIGMNTLVHVPCCAGPHIIAQFATNSLNVFSGLMHGPVGVASALLLPIATTEIITRIHNKKHENRKCHHQTCDVDKAKKPWWQPRFLENKRSLALAYMISVGALFADRAEIFHKHDDHDHHDHDKKEIKKGYVYEF